jgi:hypothetical protein
LIEGLTPEIVRTIKESLATIEQQDFSRLTTQQLTDLQHLVNDMRWFMPMILVEQPISDIVRITKNPRSAEGDGSRIHRISRLKYPPAGKVKIEMGRANFRDHSVLYGSFFGLTSLKEMRIETGDIVTRTDWRMITYLEKIKASVIYQDTRIVERLPHFETFDQNLRAMLGKRPPLESELIAAGSTFMARQFTKKVPADKKVNYLISAFISNLWLNQNKLDAIIYPSVQLDLADACIAMPPDIFDQMFYPVQCKEMLVNCPTYLSTTAVATEFDAKTDTIHWNPKKSYNEGQLTAFQKQRQEERAADGT